MTFAVDWSVKCERVGSWSTRVVGQSDLFFCSCWYGYRDAWIVSYWHVYLLLFVVVLLTRLAGSWLARLVGCLLTRVVGSTLTRLLGWTLRRVLWAWCRPVPRGVQRAGGAGGGALPLLQGLQGLRLQPPRAHVRRSQLQRQRSLHQRPVRLLPGLPRTRLWHRWVGL